jgi:phytanoyl-CoA hydroxylase
MAGILSRKQLDQFESGGFLIVEDVVDAGTIEAVKDEYVERLGEVADAAYAADEVASSYAELPFEERYAKLVFENRKVFDHLDITLPLDHDGLPPDASAHTGPAALSLLSNACLLDAVESVLGPEILCNPVQHVRMKPPRGNVSDEAAKNSYIGDTNWQ